MIQFNLISYQLKVYQKWVIIHAYIKYELPVLKHLQISFYYRFSYRKAIAILLCGIMIHQLTFHIITIYLQRILLFAAH